MTERNGRHGGIWGVSLEQWVGVIQSLGIPTIFMLFVLCLAYRHIPPVVHAHIQMLDRTTQALDTMSQTLDEMKDSQYEQRALMKELCDRLKDSGRRLHADG